MEMVVTAATELTVLKTALLAVVTDNEKLPFRTINTCPFYLRILKCNSAQTPLLSGVNHFSCHLFFRKVTCDEWRCFVLRSAFVLCLILGAERGAILEKYLEQGDPSPPSPFWYDRK